MQNLTVSDYIQVISILISTFIAVSSIVISVFTLRQTNKITKETNRPYVVAYYDAINVSAPIKYLIIKNFGVSSATIDSIKFEPTVLNEYTKKPMFSSLINHTIAPSQKIMTSIDVKEPRTFRITISYHLEKDKYCDSFDINLNSISDNVYAKSHPGGAGILEKAIIDAASEITRLDL